MILRYPDLSAFDGAWEDAPIWGVQTIAYIDPIREIPLLRHQGDYYFRDDDGCIIACDVATVQCHMARQGKRTGNQALITQWAADNGYKVGEMLGEHQWERVYQLGKADRDSLRNAD